MNKQMRNLCQWVVKTSIKAGAGDCRASLTKSRFVEIRYRDRKPETIKQASTVQLALQLYVAGRYSVQNTSDLREPAVEKFISEAVSSTRLLAEDPFRALPDPKYYQGRANVDVRSVDSAYGRVSPENKHKYVRAMEEAAWGQGGDKVVSIMAGASDEMVEGVILTSNGFEGYRQSTDFSAGTFVTVGDEDGRRPNGYDYASCRMYRKLPASAEIGMGAARRATAGLGAKKIETQALPVIIENRIVPEIMDGFFEALTGWNLYQKRSFLADKKGHAVAGDKLTLIDDPFIPEGHGSWLFDADGIATRKRTVVDAGVLKEFYIDWYYSRKLGCEPTASGHGNMIIPPGPRSVADIMKDVGRGILVTDFIGGNSNPTTGDFSIGIFGQYFEKGEIVHPVSEMNVADNHLKFWKKLTECANDPWLYSAWRTPSIVFADVVVSGT